MPLISVRGALSKDDLLPAARYANWHRSAGTRFIIGAGALLLLMGVVNLVIARPGNALGPFLLASVSAAYVLAAPGLSVGNQFRSAAHVSQEGTYEFDDAQFSITRPSLRVSMPWKDVHSVVELQNQFAIFTTKSRFFSIPKRFFTPDELLRFRELIEQALRKQGKRLVA